MTPFSKQTVAGCNFPLTQQRLLYILFMLLNENWYKDLSELFQA
jgi:hypothetical protein